MKDVLVSIIFLWVLWKLFGGKTVVHKYHFTQNHNHTYDRSREGEVKVEKPAPAKSKKLPDNAGEYIDYEEIK